MGAWDLGSRSSVGSWNCTTAASVPRAKGRVRARLSSWNYHSAAPRLRSDTVGTRRDAPAPGFSRVGLPEISRLTLVTGWSVLVEFSVQALVEHHDTRKEGLVMELAQHATNLVEVEIKCRHW